jgi:hypothetical protein
VQWINNEHNMVTVHKIKIWNKRTGSIHACGAAALLGMERDLIRTAAAT